MSLDPKNSSGYALNHLVLAKLAAGVLHERFEVSRLPDGTNFQEQVHPQAGTFIFEPVHYQTNRCNLRCSYCFVIDECIDKAILEAEYEKQELFHIIDEFYEMGTRMIFLLGGEPLVHPDSAYFSCH